MNKWKQIFWISSTNQTFPRYKILIGQLFSQLECEDLSHDFIAGYDWHRGTRFW